MTEQEVGPGCMKVGKTAGRCNAAVDKEIEGGHVWVVSLMHNVVTPSLHVTYMYCYLVSFAVV